MATYQCPKGHASTDPNYCSECGALIGASTISHATPASTASSSGPDLCPDCQTPRVPGARFCEVCRYDFDTRSSSGHVSAAQAAAATSASPSAATSGQRNAATAAGSAPTAPAPRLDVVVVTDPSLAEDDEMRKKCPTDAPELVFPLDLDETLVGRRSDAKKIFPDVDVSDPGVSHRQLKLLRQPDGSFAVLELGSANGTTLNGSALKPGLMTPVAAGDELIVGMWTRLRLRRR